jgi:hypothetical protein
LPRFLFTQTSELAPDLRVLDPDLAANAEPESFAENIAVMKASAPRSVLEVRDHEGRVKAFVSYPRA